MNPKTDAMCSNGGCRREPRYKITSECFHCWLGTKWDSMKQRTDNKRNYYPGWQGLPLGFTRKEFVAWGLQNPPLDDMERPSVDRIDSSIGYVWGNIQWLSVIQNSRNKQKDVSLDMRRCPKCKEIKKLCHENFHRNNKALGFQHYCKPCRSGT